MSAQQYDSARLWNLRVPGPLAGYAVMVVIVGATSASSTISSLD
jgi:hypothetical protein